MCVCVCVCVCVCMSSVASANYSSDLPIHNDVLLCLSQLYLHIKLLLLYPLCVCVYMCVWYVCTCVCMCGWVFCVWVCVGVWVVSLGFTLLIIFNNYTNAYFKTFKNCAQT